MTTQTPALAVLLALAAAGCGESPGPAPGPTLPAKPLPAPSSAPTSAPEPPAPLPPPARTMRTVAAMPTSPENLIHDPDLEGAFSDLVNPSGFEVYTIFPDRVTLRVRHEATTPAGPSVPVLYVASTNNRGTVVLSAQGGSGPFVASVWIGARANQRASEVSIVGYAEGNKAPLVREDATKQIIADLAWVRYAARIEESIAGTAYLAVRVPNGNEVALAAPELIGQAPSCPPTLVASAVHRIDDALRAQVDAAERFRRDHAPRVLRRPSGPVR